MDVILGGFTSNGEKMKVKISLGALSNPIPLEKLRTVFVFALAHLEGPPQAYAGLPDDPLNTRLITAHPQLLPLAQLSGMAVTPCWATLLTIGISGSTANHPSSQIH